MDQSNLKLTIYSGEYLPLLFSYCGVPTSLNLQLCPAGSFKIYDYFIEKGGTYKPKCPEVATLSIATKGEDLKEENKKIKDVVLKMQRNISSKINHEYIFEIGRNEQGIVIFAGSGSKETFRANFKKRLAEAFFNLEWICEKTPNEHEVDEYLFYINIYENMKKREGDLPEYLVNPAEQLKKKLGLNRLL